MTIVQHPPCSWSSGFAKHLLLGRFPKRKSGPATDVADVADASAEADDEAGDFGIFCQRLRLYANSLTQILYIYIYIYIFIYIIYIYIYIRYHIYIYIYIYTCTIIHCCVSIYISIFLHIIGICLCRWTHGMCGTCVCVCSRRIDIINHEMEDVMCLGVFDTKKQIGISRLFYTQHMISQGTTAGNVFTALFLWALFLSAKPYLS